MQSALPPSARAWSAGSTAGRAAAESPITIALALLLAGAPAASVTAADWADHLTWLPVFATAGVLFALYLHHRRLSAPWAHTVGLATGVLFVLLYFAAVGDRGGWQDRLMFLGRRIGDWVDVAVARAATRSCSR
jgi:hypothetical protein